MFVMVRTREFRTRSSRLQRKRQLELTLPEFESLTRCVYVSQIEIVWDFAVYVVIFQLTVIHHRIDIYKSLLSPLPWHGMYRCDI